MLHTWPSFCCFQTSKTSTKQTNNIGVDLTETANNSTHAFRKNSCLSTVREERWGPEVRTPHNREGKQKESERFRDKGKRETDGGGNWTERPASPLASVCPPALRPDTLHLLASVRWGRMGAMFPLSHTTRGACLQRGGREKGPL